MNIRVKVPGNLREHTLELAIANYVPAVHPIRHGHPDSWTPGEGASFEVRSAWMVSPTKFRLLPRYMREGIEEKYEDQIVKALDAYY